MRRGIAGGNLHVTVHIQDAVFGLSADFAEIGLRPGGNRVHGQGRCQGGVLAGRAGCGSYTVLHLLVRPEGDSADMLAVCFLRQRRAVLDRGHRLRRINGCGNARADARFPGGPRVAGSVRVHGVSHIVLRFNAQLSVQLHIRFFKHPGLAVRLGHLDRNCSADAGGAAAESGLAFRLNAGFSEGLDLHVSGAFHAALDLRLVVALGHRQGQGSPQAGIRRVRGGPFGHSGAVRQRPYIRRSLREKSHIPAGGHRSGRFSVVRFARDHRLAFILCNAHRGRTGQLHALGLADNRLRIGRVHIGRADPDPGCRIRVLRNQQVVAALVIRLDDRGPDGALAVVHHGILGRQAVLLEGFARRGVHHKPELLSRCNAGQAFSVLFRFIGQDGAVTAAVRQHQLDRPVFLVDSVFHQVPGHVPHQRPDIDGALRRLVIPVLKGIRAGGCCLPVRIVVRVFLILHKEGCVGLVPGKGILSVSVQGQGRGRRIAGRPGIQSAPLHGFDPVSCRRFHGDADLMVFIFCKGNLAVHTGLVIQLDSLSGRSAAGGHLADCGVHLFQVVIAEAQRLLDRSPQSGEIAVHALHGVLFRGTGRGGAGGSGVHFFRRVGLDVHIFSGSNLGRRRNFRLHTLQDKGQGCIAAGAARGRIAAPFRQGGHLQVAVGGNSHLVPGLQCSGHRAFCIANHIGSGNGGRNTGETGIRPGFNLRIRFGRNPDAVGGNNLCRFGNIDDGIRLDQGNRKRQPFVGSTVPVLVGIPNPAGGFHLGKNADAAFAFDGGNSTLVLGITGIDFAVHIHDGFGDLDIDQAAVRRQGDDSALLLCFGEDQHVPGADDLSVDGYRSRMGQVQQADRNIIRAPGNLPRRTGRSHTGSGFRFNAYQPRLDGSVHLDCSAQKDQLQSVRGNVFAHLQRVVVFDNHIGQQKIRGSAEKKIVIEAAGIDIICKVVRQLGGGIHELHLRLVGQVIRNALDGAGIIGNRHRFSVAVCQLDVSRCAGCAVCIQRAGRMDPVIARAADDGHRVRRVRNRDVHIGQVGAVAQVDPKGAVGGSPFAGNDDGIIAVSGADRHKLRFSLSKRFPVSGRGDPDGIIALAGLDAGGAVGGHLGVNRIIAVTGPDGSSAAALDHGLHRILSGFCFNGQAAACIGSGCNRIRLFPGPDGRRFPGPLEGQVHGVFPVSGLDFRIGAFQFGPDGVAALSGIDADALRVLGGNADAVLALTGVHFRLGSGAADTDVHAVIRPGAEIGQG